MRALIVISHENVSFKRSMESVSGSSEIILENTVNIVMRKANLLKIVTFLKYLNKLKFSFLRVYKL